MDSEENTLSQKLELVLNNFLVPGFSNARSADFEQLATYLANKEHDKFLEHPILTWIDRSVNILLTNFQGLNHIVTTLIFKLCAICAENESLMINLREQNILEKITIIVENNLPKFTPSNKLGHILLLTAISKHNQGLQWIKESKSWCYIVKYCCQNDTMYVVRDSSLLIYDFLYTFSTSKTIDEDFCLEIINEILKPFDDHNVYQNSSSTVVYVDDSKIQNELCPTLDLISLIFEKTLDSKEKTPIVHLCDVHHQFFMNIRKLAKVTHNEFFLEKILKAQTSFNFAMLVYQKLDDADEKMDSNDFNEFGVNFFETMKFCVSRKSCSNFLKLAKMNHLLWKKLGGFRAPLEILIENERIQFENQLVMFQLMPVLCVVKTQNENEESTTTFDQYIKKLFSISSELTVEICHSFRDILLDSGIDFAAHLAYKSIHEILAMKSSLNKNQAVILFKALVYALKEFAIGSQKESSTTQRLSQVLYASLACLYTLVKEFNITWKESSSIENISLMDIVLHILENPNLSSLTVVQSIKLAQLSIEHFHSPNMVASFGNNLERSSGDGLQNLAPVVIKKLHSIEWEVRDSTLELVTSIVSMSRLKFPPFQQYILGNNLCQLVFDIVHNDSEFYVRAQGLKCLTQMIAVNIHWENALFNLNLLNYLLEMICNESEGIVRKEAIICVTQMLTHNRIDGSSTNSLYCTLADIGVNDLYWEVKVAVIKFWEVVIQKLFTINGMMVDGTFLTSVTEKETILRIEKILNELSQIGCLNVIVKCLNDDCDLEVVKVAVLVVKMIFQKLDLNNYYKKRLADDEKLQKHSTLDDTGAGSCHRLLLTEENYGNRSTTNIDTNIIDDIVSTRDIQLLTTSFTKQANVNAKNNVKTENNFVIISSKEFVSQLSGVDFDELVENRKNWFHSSESLSTFLDDLILSGNIQNLPHADCY